MTGAAGSETAAATPAPATGTPAAPTGDGGAAVGSAAAAAPADPFSGLDTGTREWAGKVGIDLSDPVKAATASISKARQAESLIGKSVQIPDANASAEDWNKFYGRVGRPEKADGYEFKLPDGLPENMPYDGDFAKEFKSWAHENGLTSRQAAMIHDKWVGKAADGFKAQQEAFTARVSDATGELEKAWGPRDGEKFKANVEDATKALKGLAGGKLEASFKAAGLLSELDGKPIVVDPAIALALADIGSKLFREDALVTGGAANAATNPFSEGPNKGNATAQNILWKQDQAKAETLIRAAGFTPEQFGYRGTKAA